jgi:molybdopterin-binding protein
MTQRPITSTRLCELLGVSAKTLYQWEREGKIPRAARDRRRWRTYSPRQVEAIRRFAGVSPAPAPSGRERSEARELAGLSARNQLRGTVVAITSEGLLCEVVLRLGDGQEIVSVVTRSSVRRLGLRKGEEALAVIKSTEVMLFK